MRKVLLDKLSSYSLFFNISHCSICLFCLGMICWLDLCIIELIWNMLIMFWFVRFTFHFLFLISFGCGWEECNFLFWSFHVISSSLASISNHVTGFFRFFGSKRSLWGSTFYLTLLRIPFCQLYRNFHYLCYVLVLFVDLCYCLCAFVFCFLFLWFLWFWVRTTWFAFGSILPLNVIFLFSSFHLMSVSFATIYNHITSFFQVIREQVKFMKKYFFSKFHSNSLPYRIVRYVCYKWVLFFYFMYAL